MADLADLVLATGAVGTAAFGVVEGAKSFRCIAMMGYRHVSSLLERLGLSGVLERAYGSHVEDMLEALYRKDARELGRMIRQGVRIGLRSDDARLISTHLGWEKALVDALSHAVARIPQPEALTRVSDQEGGPGASLPLSDADRGVIARFELAIDSRIEAATFAADKTFAGRARWAAAWVAISLSLFAAAAGVTLEPTPATPLGWLESLERNWVWALVIGIAATPLAPIAKDLARTLQAARRAIGSAA